MRAKTRADLPRQLAMDNDVHLALLADDKPPLPVSMERLEADFERRTKEPNVAWFAIDVDGKYIGSCGLHAFEATHHTCTLGIVIGDPAYQGHGYGREAIGLLLDYAFRMRNVQKVWLTTGGNNDRAIRCYRACGFVEEGRLRRHEWSGGEYLDLVYMGILREEWAAGKETT
ncbi:MAG: GNAT family N-acetyltransferase [Chloroflexia bacterium]|nr:GNAT family N-acetyltransferase [Chloroflexia bacterium]